MSVPLDSLAAEPVDFRRDRWGRPHILQADGKRIGYTRCSSAAKTIEDTYNLEKWARRNVAYGMAHDASLVARVVAIGGDPSTWAKADKDAVNAIVEAAEQVAKAHKAADIGTAVHRLTERVDRGEQVDGGPYQADLDAYVDALAAAGLTRDRRHIECRIVNDGLQMAGTADRILQRSDGAHVIADIKTSASVDFGGLGWAAQLAAYAGGVLYDVETEQRLPTPDMDRDIGYIIHLPAGQGTCTIYQVDIAAGLEAARLANDIRATRKASKQWIRPYASTGPDRDELRNRYRALPADDQAQFRALNIDSDDLAAIATELDRLEQAAQARVEARQKANRILEADVPAADGTDVILAAYAELLDDERRLWVGSIVSAPVKHGTIRYSYNKTQRNADICIALAKWAGSPHWDPDHDDGLRAAIYIASGSELALQDGLSVPDALAQLDAAMAAEFKNTIDAIADDLLVYAVEDDGTARWTTAAA